jgi:hypothetical protein
MTQLKKVLLTYSVFLLSAFGATAQNDFCGIKNTSFKEGEKVTYKVYYNMGALWIGAGIAEFNTKLVDYNGKKAYHITGDGKTLKSYEWFYKVRDRYETYLDVSTLLPMKFLRNVNEGGFKIHNNVTFNQTMGQAISTNGSFKVPPCVQDVLSAIYYARNIDYSKYKAGDKIPFSMFLDDQVYNLFIRYQGKERITTKYGTFNTIKISPLLISGTIFKDGEKMMDSPILVGSIKVDMIGYEHLRNPLTSMLSKK